MIDWASFIFCFLMGGNFGRWKYATNPTDSHQKYCQVAGNKMIQWQPIENVKYGLKHDLLFYLLRKKLDIKYCVLKCPNFK